MIREAEQDEGPALTRWRQDRRAEARLIQRASLGFRLVGLVVAPAVGLAFGLIVFFVIEFVGFGLWRVFMAAIRRRRQRSMPAPELLTSLRGAAGLVQRLRWRRMLADTIVTGGGLSVLVAALLLPIRPRGLSILNGVLDHGFIVAVLVFSLVGIAIDLVKNLLGVPLLPALEEWTNDELTDAHRTRALRTGFLVLVAGGAVLAAAAWWAPIEAVRIGLIAWVYAGLAAASLDFALQERAADDDG